MAAHAEGNDFPLQVEIARMRGADLAPVFASWHTPLPPAERARPGTALADERRVLEMVASGCSLRDVLNALCRFVEGVSGECRCGIYLVDRRSGRLCTFAAPSLPSSLNDAISGLASGRSTYLETEVIAADVESDPIWQASAFQSLALAHGQRSCWSTPITSPTRGALGTFVVVQSKPAYPTSSQRNVIAKVTHIAGVAIERSQADAALKRSEAFLVEAQRLSSTGSFSWRVATDDLTWSEQLYRIFDIDERTTPTFTLIDSRVHPDDLSAVRDMRDRARADGRDIESEYRIVMPDHSIKYLHMVAHGTRDRHGCLEYIGAIQDITQRHTAEDALDKARSELARVAKIMSLGALTASIAHEVNQPLSGVVTNAGTCLWMLTANPPDTEGARETARRALRDGNRASEVIARLRALFENKEPNRDPVDLNDATREVIALSFNERQRNRVTLRAELAEDLPLVLGDRVQLQQVILNLLVNASDSMMGVEDRARCVTIRTEAAMHDRVRLTVTDTGVGLAAPAMARLFEPFCTTKRTGMGIGLFVSRSIIESHQGEIEVKANDGPGVTFSFLLPQCGRSLAPPPPGNEVTDSAPIRLPSEAARSMRQA